MGKNRKRLVTIDEAVPATRQHTRPCSDCPWARASLNGWLGGATIEEWLADAHRDVVIDCHTLDGAQCAGSAIYRRNVCKKLIDKSILVLPTDKVAVFATPMEFAEHHRQLPKKGG